MKKMIALFLALIILAATSVTGVAETQELSLVIVDAMGLDQDTWFSTELSRAMLTILIGMELANTEEEMEIGDFLVCPSFVGMMPEEVGLAVIFGTEPQAYIVMYMPKLKNTRYATMDVSDMSDVSSMIEIATASTCDEYHKNSAEDLMSALTLMTEALEELN